MPAWLDLALLLVTLIAVVWAGWLSHRVKELTHLVDQPTQTDHFVRCSNCRTSFAASSQACPSCGDTALLDLQQNIPTQRGIQAYIRKLEGELTEALRSLAKILHMLINAEKV